MAGVLGDELDAGRLVGRDSLITQVSAEALTGPLPYFRRHVSVPRRPWLIELHGRAGSGTSAVARKVAEVIGGERGQPVHQLPYTGDDPRSLLLLLAARVGVPPKDLMETVWEQRDISWLSGVCQEALARRPAVVVVDGLPPGAGGLPLLRAVDDALATTESLILATSRADASSYPGHPSVWEVPPLPPHHSADLLGLPDTVAEPLHRACRGLPVLLRVARGLLHDGRWEGPVPGTPEELFRQVQNSLAADAKAMLSAFTVLDLAELPDAMARALPVPDANGALQELLMRGVLHHPRPGYWRLPSVLAELARRGRPLWRAASLRRLERAVLREIPSAPLEPSVLLAERMVISGASQARGHIDPIARALVRRNDLARLLLLAQATDVALPLAALARQTGHVDLAHHIVDSIDEPAVTRSESAVLARETGQLGRADWSLFTLEPEGPRDENARLRAAVSLDQGRVRGAAGLIRSAVEHHQITGDESGEAWAAYEYGRLRLVVGDPRGAEVHLRTARRLFGLGGELRGVAWADTGLAWALLLGGDPSRAVPALQRAVTGHRRAHDPRGEGWALLRYALALAEEGSADSADHSLNRALDRFEDVDDALGAAWTRHHLALQDSSGEVSMPALWDVAHDFQAIGCTGGLAWTRLEIGRRTAQPSLVAQARGLFVGTENEAGEHWADFTAAVIERDGAARVRALKELSRFHPPALIPRTPTAHIPRAARYTVPERLPDGSGSVENPRPEDRCRVLLTLLDEVYEGGTARITVGVEPGTAHPWAFVGPEDTPLLSVSATPLGDAELRPEHAVTVWPSLAGAAREGGGSEFRITPHRAGPLGLRFTVEDRRSGVVLQQVETEVQVLTPALVPSTRGEG
ncbi:hypothetical protein [Streptomyces sp. NBC_00690]|uniref:hypothetical protein n=1 Tax=Streptomyces sp. NBC_00690 TaxID=2975808 RepID=UPI002E2ADC0D|nr:hypothetical protein [Streptomyces sp. NBC_00690]